MVGLAVVINTKAPHLEGLGLFGNFVVSRGRVDRLTARVGLQHRGFAVSTFHVVLKLTGRIDYMNSIIQIRLAEGHRHKL